MPYFEIEARPDVQALLGVIRRERSPHRVHHLELFLDPEVKEALARRFGLEEGLEPSDPHYTLRRDIRLHAFLGYDAFRLPLAPKKIFGLPELAAADTAEGPQNRGERPWTEEHAGRTSRPTPGPRSGTSTCRSWNGRRRTCRRTWGCTT
jgi:hypothetical protein